MGAILVSIQFHFETCAGNEDEKSRWTKQETGLEGRCRKRQ